MRRPFSSLPWPTLLWLAATAACTEPRFRSDDAGSDASCVTCTDDGSLDASSDPADRADDAGSTVSVPSGLTLGHFAARTHSYTTDGFAAARGVGYTYVDIRRGEHDVVMTDHYCSFDGAWSLFLQVNGSLVYPEDLPPREITVHQSNDGWYTRDTPYALGYTFEPPAACSPGLTIASTKHPWNDGTCVCPTSTAAPPSNPKDCRVTDPDDDDGPGLSVDVDISGSDSIFRVVQENHDLYLKGHTKPDGSMVAQFNSVTRGAVLECQPADPCTFGNPKACDPVNNETEFVPIPDDWTCQEVLANVGTLFPTPAPERPLNCNP